MKATFQQHLVRDQHDGRPPSITMDLHTDDGVVHLQERQHVSLHNARGWTVLALSGKVWITQDWDLRDVVLEAGQCFVLDRNGSALLWPLAKTEVRVTLESGRTASRRLSVRSEPVPAFSAVRALFA